MCCGCSLVWTLNSKEIQVSHKNCLSKRYKIIIVIKWLFLLSDEKGLELMLSFLEKIQNEVNNQEKQLKTFRRSFLWYKLDKKAFCTILTRYLIYYNIYCFTLFKFNAQIRQYHSTIISLETPGTHHFICAETGHQRLRQEGESATTMPTFSTTQWKFIYSVVE